MKNIFIGFILIFLDFNLNINNSQIGLIPDFAGYLVMMGGLTEMAGESGFFIKVKPYAAGMAVYTGILYLLDLVGVSASLGALAYMLAVASTAVSLYISYSIVMGVMEMEAARSTFLNGENLKSMWKLLAVFSILSFASLLIPAAAVICILISFVAAVCFLVAFNNSKNLYYDSIRKL